MSAFGKEKVLFRLDDIPAHSSLTAYSPQWLFTVTGSEEMARWEKIHLKCKSHRWDKHIHTSFDHTNQTSKYICFEGYRTPSNRSNLQTITSIWYSCQTDNFLNYPRRLMLSFILWRSNRFWCPSAVFIPWNCLQQLSGSSANFVVLFRWSSRC